MVTLGTKLNVANVFVISSSFGHTGVNVYILRPVKGNPINISWGGEFIRGNGGAVQWQSIRRLIHRFP